MRSFLQWRTDFGADKVLHTFQFPQYEQIARIYPMFYCGTGAAGHAWGRDTCGATGL